VLFGGDFHVDPTHPEQVTVVLPDDQREVAVAHLEKWVILEDVTVAFDSDIHVLVLAPGTPAIATLPAACVRLRGFAADLVLVGSDDLTDAQAALESAAILRLSRQAWHDALIPEGIALAGLDLRLGETIPLEAGAFHAVSFNKGCYLGQEVIERLHSRGRPNKRLLRVEVDGPPPAPDTRLHDPDGNEVGWITRATRGDDDARWVALAYVRRRALEAEVALRTADGADVSLRGYVGGERPGALS
jgi:folate-binding protein YgfZ